MKLTNFRAEQTAKTNKNSLNVSSTDILRKTLVGVFAILLFLCMFSSSDLLSATNPHARYTVTVDYIACPGGGSARTESWHKGSSPNGPIVYQHVTDCDGEVTEIGEKPIRYFEGEEVWDAAVIDAMKNKIPVATALAADYKPIIDSVIVLETEDAEDRLYYQFEFPIEWVYEIANTSVLQTAVGITLNTDDFVQAQIVNLSTGEVLTPITDVNATHTFDIGGFSAGCIYSIVVQQYITEAEETLIIKNHNFCK